MRHGRFRSARVSSSKTWRKRASGVFRLLTPTDLDRPVAGGGFRAVILDRDGTRLAPQRARTARRGLRLSPSPSLRPSLPPRVRPRTRLRRALDRVPAAGALGPQVRDRRSEPRRHRRKLVLYAALLLGVACVRALFLFLMRRIIIGASRDIEYDMRNDFFARLQQQPLGYYQARRTGDLMSRATNDLNAVRMMIGPAVMYSASTVLVFVVAIILMAAIDVPADADRAHPAAVRLDQRSSTSAAPSTRASRRSRRSSPSSARSSRRRCRASASCAPTGRKRTRSSGSAAANEEYVRRNRVLIRLQGLFYPSMTLFLGFGSLLVLWLGSRDVIRGQHHARRVRRLQRLPGDAELADDRVRLGHEHPAARDGLVEADARGPRRAPAISDATSTPTPAVPPIDGAIEIRNLTFAYPGTDRAVLERRHAADRARPDRRVRRRHRLGQVDARQPAAAPARSAARARCSSTASTSARFRSIALRGAIGFVPQEPFLFSDTIAENIAFGVQAAGADGNSDLERRVADAAAVARLDKDVESFPNGYETTVGERGITLSGGQKQRTALARALMIDPRDPHPGRRAVGRGYLHGGGDPDAPARRDASADLDHRLPPHLDRARRRSDLRARRRPHRRARVRTSTLVAHGGLYATLYKQQLLEEELAAS